MPKSDIDPNITISTCYSAARYHSSPQPLAGICSTPYYHELGSAGHLGYRETNVRPYFDDTLDYNFDDDAADSLVISSPRNRGLYVYFELEIDGWDWGEEILEDNI